MKIRSVLIAACILAAVWVGIAANPAEGLIGAEERDEWRVKIGPAFNFGLKSRIGIDSARAITLMPQYVAPQGYATREEALARMGYKADGTRNPDAVRYYKNGAWINPKDSAGIAGETWNFRVPDANQLIKDEQLKLSSDKVYVEAHSEVTRMQSTSDRDDYVAPGVSLELSRTLYHNDKQHWGVEIFGGFSWFTRNNCFSGGSELARRTDIASAITLSDVYDVSYLHYGEGPDDYMFEADGTTLGHGTSPTAIPTDPGAGPILLLDRVRLMTEASLLDSSVETLSYHFCGDYNEFELTAGLHPYYEPWEWLRIFGTVGIGVSYTRLHIKENLYTSSENIYDNTHHENDWDVYGVFGLGAEVRYSRYFLGCEFDARVWRHDIDIEGEYLRGRLQRGSWLLRAYLGLEF